MLSFVAVVAVPLVGYTAADVWFASTEHRNALIEIQRANAENAAFRISQFIRDIEGQLRWMTHLSWEDADGKQQLIDALRLLRQAPAIVDLSLIDEMGRERLFVSRISMDRISSLNDRSGEIAFSDALRTGIHHGAVYFQRDSELLHDRSALGNASRSRGRGGRGQSRAGAEYRLSGSRRA